MGRRNLLTTASNGSANGLQDISDRLADNFSILPGHHGTGDNGDGDGEGNEGGVSGEEGGEAEEGEGDDDDGGGSGGGGLMSKSFAMFECGREGEREGGAQSQSVRTGGGREREPSLSPCVIYQRTPPTHTHTHTHTHTPVQGQSNFNLKQFVIIIEEKIKHMNQSNFIYTALFRQNQRSIQVIEWNMV